MCRKVWLAVINFLHPFAVACNGFLARHWKRVSVVVPSVLFGLLVAQAISSSWALQNSGDSRFYRNGGEQPSMFALLGQDDSPGAARAKKVRQRSEAALEQRFEEHQKGLWQAGLSGSKEDHLKKIRNAIREASQDDGFGPFARTVSDGLNVQQTPPVVAAVNEDPADFRPFNIGVPIGPLFGTLGGQVFPITVISPGGEDDGDEEGEIPEDPTDPETPEPPIVVNPEPPVGEVPIPGAVVLFPVGLAFLARRRKKASA